KPEVVEDALVHVQGPGDRVSLRGRLWSPRSPSAPSRSRPVRPPTDAQAGIVVGHCPAGGGAGWYVCTTTPVGKLTLSTSVKVRLGTVAKRRLVPVPRMIGWIIRRYSSMRS